MKRGQFLNLIVLLVCMLCTLAANAYDFEVDGIYYNKTSSNTVEVTYKSIGDSIIAYRDTVIIPNTVAYNGRNYTVTAIGDSAFYGGFQNNYYPNCACVTIPETITMIGKKAFRRNLIKLTCLSATPPEMEGAFDYSDEEYHYENEYYSGFPFNVFDTNDYWWMGTPMDGLFFSEAAVFLYVPSEAYQSYKDVNNSYHYFYCIFCYNVGKTTIPSVKAEYTYSLSRLVFVSLTLTPNEESRLFIDEHFTSGIGAWSSGYDTYDSDSTISITICDPWYTHSTLYCVRCIAVAEGKLPSDIIVEFYDLDVPFICDFDFIDENGICYTDYYSNAYGLGGNPENGFDIGSDVVYGESVWISGGIYRDPYDGNGTKHRYTEYSEHIVAPTKVRGCTVVGANFDAFIDSPNLTGLSLPFSEYLCFAGCTALKKLVLPVSCAIDFYTGNSEDEHIEFESVYLFGKGNKGGYFDANYSVDTLYLGSDVTGIDYFGNPSIIYSYSTTPPSFTGDNYEYEEPFAGYDAELHVPASALAAYFTAPYWCNFTNIIGDINPITDFSFAQDSIQMLKGSSTTLQTIVTPAHVDPGYILWQSTNKNVATVNNGVVTAVGTGECEIQAICQGIFVVCRVFVTEILPTEVILSQESAKMEVGGQLTLTATVLPEDATNKTVTWSSSRPSVATVDNGVVTAIAPGECDIIARCNGKEARCHIVVVEHFIYISLDEHEASLLPNHILILTPTVTPVSTDLKVTSSNPAVAAARLAGDKIQVVGIREGEATIVVQSVDGEAEPDSCHVTVYTMVGDVDCDGYVSIADVTALIDILLGVDNPSYSMENADCDQDGEISIADVTALIDALLLDTPLPDKDMKVITVNGVTFKMVKVKGGTFTMGATEEEDSDYQVFVGSPEHQVTLSDYYIGQTEVTQELWAAVMGSNPSYDTTNTLYPVNSVSWEDCAAFISQLNALTGLQFRLPTEAEWEFAAQGGTKSRGYVYAGSNDLDEVAWFYTNSDNTCHQVGTKKPNELGLYDMNGNIEEWCNDWYSLYTAEAVVNPTGPETGLSRIHRGGRWSGGERYCRLTRRDGFRPNVVRNYMGLRLAL